MSTSAVNAVSQARQQYNDAPAPATSAPSVTPFSQQLDAQTTAKGHHHHLSGGASQSVASSASSAASAAGGATPSTLASSLLHLIS